MTAPARDISAPPRPAVSCPERPAPANARRARGAEPLSIDAVYRREFAFVWRLVRYFGVPARAAEDVVQEVFITAYRRRDAYDARVGSVRAWLHGIAQRSALRYHRTSQRKDPRRFERDARELATRPANDPGTDPESRLARDQAARVVESFLDALAPERREVFTLHDIEGLAAPAIAELLGVKINTVYSRLRRARAQFRAHVARHRARDRRHRHAR